MLDSFKLEIPLKRFERVRVITSSIREADKNATLLLIRLELEDAEVMRLYGLEALVQALQKVVLT